MIQESFIREWSEMAPWSKNEMVEQDLIICRALVSIFSDPFLKENLAFRGGTALHKLFLQPQARYSEDIDLVQIKPGPIKPIMFRLGEVLEIGQGIHFNGFCRVRSNHREATNSPNRKILPAFAELHRRCSKSRALTLRSTVCRSSSI